MATILCVLYDDPVDGYPPDYPRDEIPKIEKYPDGQTTPTPESIDFPPGRAAGVRVGRARAAQVPRGGGSRPDRHLGQGRPGLEFEQRLPEADVVISQPFWPAYLTAERIAKAPNLKLAITAGIGSDHVDLQAAMDAGMTVAEVTYCNSISVSEHVVMMILSLVRNYIPSYQTVVDGGWNIADCVSRSYDVEGMHVGTVAAGRIGSAVLRRLAVRDGPPPHGPPPPLRGRGRARRHLLRVDRGHGAPLRRGDDQRAAPSRDRGPVRRRDDRAHEARRLHRQHGAGKICDRDAIVRALSRAARGYAGDVWFPQPAPRDHLWRTMPHHGMTPHISGSSLSAQARYAAGTREILESFFADRPCARST